MSKPTVTVRDQYRIALEADIQLRTLERYFAGRVLKQTTHRRIEGALRKLELREFIRIEPTPAKETT